MKKGTRMKDDIRSGLKSVPMMKPFERTRVRYSRWMIAFSLSIYLSVEEARGLRNRRNRPEQTETGQGTIRLLRFFRMFRNPPRQFFQESSGKFRSVFVLFQIVFQPFKIFRRVYVVP